MTEQKINNTYEYDEQYEILIVNLVRLCGRIGKKIEQFPYIHRKNLGDQLNRSSSSVPSNLEEGRGRSYLGAVRDEGQFLHYALGSAREAKVQLLMCCSTGLIKETQKRNAIKVLVEAIEFTEGRLTLISKDGYSKSQYKKIVDANGLDNEDPNSEDWD